eukprot:1841552-Prymnesium_polylepis.1
METAHLHAASRMPPSLLPSPVLRFTKTSSCSSLATGPAVSTTTSNACGCPIWDLLWPLRVCPGGRWPMLSPKAVSGRYARPA